MARTFRNPILQGCYPDPSICRVGEDYYLVTSTFEYFPGLPIFHSRDLVHGRQIGHVLERASQLPLQSVRASGGLYANDTLFEWYVLRDQYIGGWQDEVGRFHGDRNRSADFDWFEAYGLK
jgi:hypothetical protein